MEGRRGNAMKGKERQGKGKGGRNWGVKERKEKRKDKQ